MATQIATAATDFVRGWGETEHEAIMGFVQDLLEKNDISISEMMT